VHLYSTAQVFILIYHVTVIELELPELQCSAVLFSHLILYGNKMRMLINGQAPRVTLCVSFVGHT